MRQVFFSVGSLATVVLATLVTAAPPTSSPVAPSWSDVSFDRRCDGLLDFFKAVSVKDMPGWSLRKPRCVSSGVAAGDSKWSFDIDYVKGETTMTLRYIVEEIKGRKASTFWCQFKGDQSSCASPWDNGFFRGDLYPKVDDAKLAYENLVKKNPGLLSLVTHLDAWISKEGQGEKIFGLSYDTWLEGWVKTIRRLPTKDGDVLAEFSPKLDSLKAGTVVFKGVIPQSLRNCLGCGKTPCEKSVVNYEFHGLGLALERRLTADEQKASDRKVGRGSWVLTESSPIVSGKPKWPFLCGEHRYNIQKF